MTTTLGNKVLILGILAAAIMFSLVFGPGLIKAATSFVSSQTSNGLTTLNASTTPIFLLQGTNIATSTYQLDGLALNKVQEMGEVDMLGINLAFTASSSAGVINVMQQVSDNNVDWYNVSNTPVIASGAVSSIPVGTSTTYAYTPGIVGTSSVAFNLPLVPAKHERLVFTLGAGGGAGAYYAEVTLKRLPTTP